MSFPAFGGARDATIWPAMIWQHSGERILLPKCPYSPQEETFLQGQELRVQEETFLQGRELRVQEETFLQGWELRVTTLIFLSGRTWHSFHCRAWKYQKHLAQPLLKPGMAVESKSDLCNRIVNLFWDLENLLEKTFIFHKMNAQEGILFLGFWKQLVEDNWALVPVALEPKQPLCEHEEKGLQGKPIWWERQSRKMDVVELN